MFDSQQLRTDYTVTANYMQDMAKDLGTNKHGVSLCKKKSKYEVCDEQFYQKVLFLRKTSLISNDKLVSRCVKKIQLCV